MQWITITGLPIFAWSCWVTLPLLPIITLVLSKLQPTSFSFSILGELFTFHADYDNDKSRSMSWPRGSVLQLKSGCKVMLVWNKSDDLRNGTLGTFTGISGNGKLLLNFEEVGNVEIGRKTWIKRERNGQRVGSVTQFPVVLAYAVTCHKSQGYLCHLQLCSALDSTFQA